MSEHPKAAPSTRDMEFHESKRYEADDKKVALVDIDETICFYNKKRRYDMAIGHMANNAKINDLYDQGWKIIYWTASGGSEKSKTLTFVFSTKNTFKMAKNDQIVISKS